MNPNFIFALIGVLATLSMAGTAVIFSQSAAADEGGKPNENALDGPACENSDERNERFHDRLPEEGEEDGDDNPNNDKGQFTAHDNSAHNEKGVDFETC
jgi:hypothetical protein